MVINERRPWDVRRRQLGRAQTAGETLHGLSQSRDEQTRSMYHQQTDIHCFLYLYKIQTFKYLFKKVPKIPDKNSRDSIFVSKIKENLKNIIKKNNFHNIHNIYL